MNDFLKSLFGAEKGPKQGFVPTQPKVTQAPASPAAVSPQPVVTKPATNAPKPVLSSPAAQTYIQSQLPQNTPTVQPVTPSVVPQTAPQSSSSRDAYINAYKAYRDAQMKNEEETAAKQAYNTFLAEQSKAVAGREGRGLGIPLSIVRGEQEKLLRQTQPEAARLQGEVEIAQGAKRNLLEGLKTEAELQKGIFESEQKKTPTGFELSAGQARYEYNPATGQYEAIASVAKAPASSELTPYQQFQATQSISKDTAARTENAREIARQSGLMNQAYNSFVSGGDRSIATQAIITTFNKILDPTSVVRESEYDRTAAGQALLSRIQGKYENIVQGGAGVTRETLKAAVDLADEYMKNAQASLVRENERARNLATEFGLNPEFVVSGGSGFSPEEQQTTDTFDDVVEYIIPDPTTKTAYIPRSVWNTLGPRMDALLADVASDGYTLKIRD